MNRSSNLTLSARPWSTKSLTVRRRMRMDDGASASSTLVLYRSEEMAPCACDREGWEVVNRTCREDSLAPDSKGFL